MKHARVLVPPSPNWYATLACCAARSPDETCLQPVLQCIGLRDLHYYKREVKAQLCLCRYSSGVACCTSQHYVYGAYSYVVVAELQSHQILAVLQGHGNKVTAVNASSSGNVAVSGSKDRSLTAWDLTNLCILRKRAKLTAEVSAVCLLQNTACTAVAALEDCSIVSWLWSQGARTALTQLC
jgi:WD40 repeat protein